MKKKLALYLLLLLSSPWCVNAATFNGILLTLSPENPGPGDRVTASASFIGATNATSYVWTLDGEVLAAGPGIATQVFEAPILGKSAELSVAVLEGDRILATESMIVTPAEVTIEWVGDGAVPDLYQGRPQFTAHGSVQAEAFADLQKNGESIPNSDILYTWKLNGRPIKGSGGYGGNTVIVRPPFFTDSFVLSVSAVSRDGSVIAEDQVVLRPKSAQGVIYETSPLDGVLTTRAIVGAYTFSQSEVSFRGYPLHVSRNGALGYRWNLNGEQTEADTGDPRLVVFKKTGSGTGVFDVSFEYSNEKGFMDLFSSSFLLQF